MCFSPGHFFFWKPQLLDWIRVWVNFSYRATSYNEALPCKQKHERQLKIGQCLNTYNKGPPNEWLKKVIFYSLAKHCSVQKFCFYWWGVLWGQLYKTKNNPGKVCDKSASSEKAQSLAQVSYEKSNHKLRVLDV